MQLLKTVLVAGVAAGAGLAAVLVFAAAPSQVSMAQLREAVAALIPDAERARRVSGLVGELEQVFNEDSEDARIESDLLRTLEAVGDAEEHDFLTVFQEFATRRERRQDRVLSIRRRLVSLTTEDEWNRLLGTRVDLVEQSIRPARADRRKERKERDADRAVERDAARLARGRAADARTRGR